MPSGDRVSPGADDVRRKHEELMRRGRGMKVLLKGYDEDTTTTGELRIQEWGRNERMARALKSGGMCWGFALLSVILPLLHFVLVPALLLAGPVVAFLVFAQEAVVLGGQGTCPHCGEPMILVRSGFSFPISDCCSHCQRAVRIELSEVIERA